MITQCRLELVCARGLQEKEDIWVELKFQNCQMDQLRIQIKLSLTSNLNSAVWGIEMVGIHTEKKAGGVVYLHGCAKMKIKRIENDFYREEVPVRLGHGEEMVLKFMNPKTKVFYQNHTLTECIPLCSNLKRLPTGSWITFGKRSRSPASYQCQSTTKPD